VPPDITITFELRITPKWSQTEAEAFIERVIQEAGDDITYEYINKGPVIPDSFDPREQVVDKLQVRM
jgi:acetylornithine deacetylase/succinyl-diaminopimelate desuccinylase-like protein